MAGRRQDQSPQLGDTGRKGYREPDEPRDERPVLVRDQFWASESERLTYEHAVASHPRWDGEGATSYMARIAEAAQGRLEPVVKVMPHRPGKQAFQRRLDVLARQTVAIRDPGEEG